MVQPPGCPVEGIVQLTARGALSLTLCPTDDHMGAVDCTAKLAAHLAGVAASIGLAHTSDYQRAGAILELVNVVVSAIGQLHAILQPSSLHVCLAGHYTLQMQDIPHLSFSVPKCATEYGPLLLPHLLPHPIALEGSLDLHSCLVQGWVTEVLTTPLSRRRANCGQLLLLLLQLSRGGRWGPDLCAQVRLGNRGLGQGKDGQGHRGQAGGRTWSAPQLQQATLHLPTGHYTTFTEAGSLRAPVVTWIKPTLTDITSHSHQTDSQGYEEYYREASSSSSGKSFNSWTNWMGGRWWMGGWTDGEWMNG